MQVLAMLSRRFKRWTSPVYRTYDQAYALYEEFISRHDIGPLGPSEDQMALAQRTPGLLEAERLYREAMQASRRGSINAAVVTYQLGLLARLFGRWPLAAARFQEALDQFEPLVGSASARDGISKCHYFLGQALLRDERREEARAHLETALSLNLATGHEVLVAATRKLLEECRVSAAVPQWPDPALQRRRGEVEKADPRAPRPGPGVEGPVSPIPAAPRVPANAAPQRNQGEGPIVWLVAFTRAGGSAMEPSIRSALHGAAPDAVLVSSACGEPRGIDDSWPQLRTSRRLCAVVFVLEASGLADQSYLEMLRWSISRVAQRDDFRLFLPPHGVRRDELQLAGIDPYNTVQQGGDLADLCQGLAAYVQELDAIRKRAAFRGLRFWAQVIGGAAAFVLEVLCLPVGLLLVLWLPVWDVHATLREHMGLEWLAAIVCGIASVPFLFLLLYVYTRHGIPSFGIWRDRSIVLPGLVATFIGPPMFMVSIRLHAPAGYVLLGAALGIVLDAARRRGHAALRDRRAVDPDSVAGRHGRLPPALRRQAAGSWINPWRSPLLAATRPIVFISYARESAWATRRAAELESELSRVGAAFFRDTAIPPGGAWRRQLDRQMGRATVVVCLADEATVLRPWPAAEMEAALARRALHGSPDIIVVRSTALPRPSEETFRWLPVFRAVLADREGARETGPEILEDGAALPQAIAFRLHAQSYRSVSVLPVWLARWLAALWLGPRLVLQLLGSIGMVYGTFGLAALQVVEWRGGPGSAWVSQPGWLTFRLLAGAAFLGYTVRMLLAARFQLREDRAPQVARAHVKVVAAQLLLIACLAGTGSALLAGCAFLLGCAAFLAADEQCERTSRARPDYIGPVD